MSGRFCFINGFKANLALNNLAWPRYELHRFRVTFQRDIDCEIKQLAGLYI